MNGDFVNQTGFCYSWTSTKSGNDKALSRILYYGSLDLLSRESFMGFGFSVRCINNKSDQAMPDLR